MSLLFVDTYFILAVLNPRDAAHQRALLLAATEKSKRPVTTQWVLTEAADALKHPADRATFIEYLRSLENDSHTQIIPATDDLFHRGLDLYGNRLDKSWSLTDCISFIVMQDLDITDALTGDQHFRQAGFTPLL